jgi:hypothetical protein
MTTSTPAPAGHSLIERVKGILFNPKEEWPRIEAEPATIGSIYLSHVIPLAAIGPIATLIGGQLFGYGMFGISYKPSLWSGIVTALVSFLLALGGTYIVAMIIEWLAPQYGAIKDRTRAFKVAAYSFTASWVAGIFAAFPSIGFLSILGLYSVYLLYLGVPVVMKAPADRAGSYSIVTIIISIIAGLLLGALAAPITGLFAASSGGLGGKLSGTVETPGGSLDMGKLSETTKKLEDAAKRVQSGQSNAIAPDALKALLPAALPGGLTRTSIESSSAGAAGMSGSNVEAVYGTGDTELRLSITDLGPLGGLASLGSALNIESSKETESGYERIGKVDGRMTTEKWDTAEKRGEYGTLIADRIMVQAKGQAASVDALKAAVVAIDLGKVEALATP